MTFGVGAGVTRVAIPRAAATLDRVAAAEDDGWDDGWVEVEVARAMASVYPLRCVEVD